MCKVWKSLKMMGMDSPKIIARVLHDRTVTSMLQEARPIAFNNIDCATSHDIFAIPTTHKRSGNFPPSDFAVVTLATYLVDVRSSSQIPCIGCIILLVREILDGRTPFPRRPG